MEPTAAPEAPAPPAPSLPARPRTAPPAAPIPARVERGLSAGLSKTRAFLGERLAAFARAEQVDETAWEALEEALIRADVGVNASVRIVGRVREHLKSADGGFGGIASSLRRELASTMQAGERGLRFAEEGPTVWLVTGVNGTGKTTSIAKLAHLLRRRGKTVVLAAADTFRAAAIDQLAAWAERVKVHVVRHSPGADPGAVVFDAIEHARARGIDVVIADTAGRLHTKTNLMDELGKVRRVVERQLGSVHEVFLVLDATVGQNGIAQARTFQEAVDVTGIILTKLDGSARGGVVVSIQEELGIPVKLVGVGETLDDLEAFDPESFAAALVKE